MHLLHVTKNLLKSTLFSSMKKVRVKGQKSQGQQIPSIVSAALPLAMIVSHGRCDNLTAFLAARVLFQY